MCVIRGGYGGDAPRSRLRGLMASMARGGGDYSLRVLSFVLGLLDEVDQLVREEEEAD